jgi:hypothetical protein
MCSDAFLRHCGAGSLQERALREYLTVKMALYIFVARLFGTYSFVFISKWEKLKARLLIIAGRHEADTETG